MHFTRNSKLTVGRHFGVCKDLGDHFKYSGKGAFIKISTGNPDLD